MKKLGPIFALAAAALAIGGRSADAGNPPDAPLLELDPPTVATGATFSATFFGCDPAGFPSDGETVNFEVAGTTVSAPCAFLCIPICRPGDDPVQGATTTLTAPAAPGTYTVTATGLTSGATGSATLTVGGMPATGSDSAPIAQAAAGLVAVGTGIVVVAGVRRRKAAAGKDMTIRMTS
jgi:hypothetical protein